MTLSEELVWRGFYHQTTLPDITDLDAAPINFFLGADPSADSLTIGNLASLMLVRRFIAHGHRATMLVGGATGLIGDPDGKKQERDLKSIEEIQRNSSSLTKQYEIVLPLGSFQVVNNYDWFRSINYIDFLRDIGKYVSMTQLLDREFIKSRIGAGGAGISYAEFSYALIQGYDFLYLNKEHGVTLQLCGADQWGNALSGVEMLRKHQGVTAHVYSVPLVVNKSTGVKFGKSEAGAVWLDPQKTSVYKFYQFWLNLDDEGVGEYIKLYTEIMPDEYEVLMKGFMANPQSRTAQKYLAQSVTTLIHGAERTKAIIQATDVLFHGANIASMEDLVLESLMEELPTYHGKGSLVDIFAQLGITTSKGEVRRLLQSGAITIDGRKVVDDITISERCLIKKGKNVFILVVP
jgi:tyrosyl-tRNA synthetase